ncbi:hypothetical protein Krac_12242 [Ktedonobacter racemifer DSM 44963]|uniref:Uncharacterized protein n=1 Tax=Ktedonobacter racemifer DSM 44963 TaxID=485913 RepID=D6TFY2_KTERA|nr:hypothetical protein Krac_12242 [Ktedonobacter racemifer DSM 44963]
MANIYFVVLWENVFLVYKRFHHIFLLSNVHFLHSDNFNNLPKLCVHVRLVRLSMLRECLKVNIMGLI